MACFLVPAAEAIVTTAVKKIADSGASKKEHQEGIGHFFTQKLSWLNKMLWGGSALLAFEHVWHGEVTPWFPFLTAAANPNDTSAMLSEMSTVGVCMAVLVTAVWAGIVLTAYGLRKKNRQSGHIVAEK